MPTIGTGKKAQHFPYTPAGEKAATEKAMATGQKMQMRPKKKKKKPNRGK